MNSEAVLKGLDGLFALGLPGIAIAGMAFVIYMQYQRNNALTDQIINLVSVTTTNNANSTAALNRMADILNVKRNAE